MCLKQSLAQEGQCQPWLWWETRACWLSSTPFPQMESLPFAFTFVEV